MQDFEVRLSHADDLRQVDELLMRSYPVLLKADYPASVLVMAIPRMARANPSLLSSGSYYVAEDCNGLIIGCGGWSIRSPDTGRRKRDEAHVRHFGTDPRAVRRGVGKAIMQRCLADVADQDLREMQCYSTRTAVPFYESQGFEVIGEMVLQLAPGVDFPAIAMVRNI